MKEMQQSIVEHVRGKERASELVDPYREQRIDEYHKHLHEIYTVTGEETEEGREVATIGKPLEADGPYKGKIHYKVIHHKTENAMACGNTVYVFSGLLAGLKTKAEIAGVIAHEITHIENGDTQAIEGAKRTIGEELSRGGIQEYIADGVANKLANAGYNPTAYENVLARFAGDQWGVGMTHGSAADRQAAYRAQLRIRDHLQTAKPDTTVKPNSFSPDALSKKYKPSAYEVIMGASEDSITKDATDAMEALGIKSLLILHSSQIGRIESLKGMMTWDRYAREYSRSDRAEYEEQLRKAVRRARAVDAVITEKIKTAHPDSSDEQRMQLRTILYTEVERVPLATLNELTSFVASRKSETLPSYGTDLEGTIHDAQDMANFARFTRSYHEMSTKAGVVPAPQGHPTMIFENITGYDSNPTYSFYSRMRAKISPNADEEYKKGFDTLNDIAEALEAYDRANPQGRTWLAMELKGQFKASVEWRRADVQNSNPNLYRRDVIRALQARQDELLNSTSEMVLTAGAMARKGGGRTPEQGFIREVENILFKDTRDIPFRQRHDAIHAFMNALSKRVVQEKRQNDEEVTKLLQAVSGGPEARRAYFQTLDLTKLQNIRDIANLRELIPDEHSRRSFVDDLVSYVLKEYQYTDQDVRSIRALCMRRAYAPSLKKWKEGMRTADDLSDKEALAQIGIGDNEIRLLASLRTLDALRHNEGYDGILREAAKTPLSIEASSILLDSLLRYYRRASSASGILYDFLDGKALTKLRDTVNESLQNEPPHIALEYILRLKGAADGKAVLIDEHASMNTFLAPMVRPVMEKVSKLEINTQSGRYPKS